MSCDGSFSSILRSQPLSCPWSRVRPLYASVHQWMHYRLQYIHNESTKGILDSVNIMAFVQRACGLVAESKRDFLISLKAEDTETCGLASLWSYTATSLWDSHHGNFSEVCSVNRSQYLSFFFPFFFLAKYKPGDGVLYGSHNQLWGSVSGLRQWPAWMNVCLLNPVASGPQR